MEKETFDLLFTCFKIIQDNMLTIPPGGEQSSYLVIKHDDDRETFNMFVNRRGYLNPNKLTYVLRSRFGVLIRLDMNGAPHCNYDGKLIDTPHLHIFNEENNFGKNAIHLSELTDIDLLVDIHESLVYFLKYNNIELIDINVELFE